MKLEKLSINELESLKEDIEREIIFKLSHDIELDKKTYYMHSISCVYLNNTISDIGFTNAESEEILTEKEYIEDLCGDVYIDDSKSVIHISFYKENKIATPEQRLELEKHFYNYINEKVTKSIDKIISERINYIGLLKEKKKSNIEKVNNFCKNYIRDKKINKLIKKENK